MSKSMFQTAILLILTGIVVVWVQAKYFSTSAGNGPNTPRTPQGGKRYAGGVTPGKLANRSVTQRPLHHKTVKVGG